MASQAKSFCRSCLSCQRAKVSKHTRAPLAQLPMPDHRFSAIHLDIVGPLPPSGSGQYCYLFTIIDRYSRWIEAVPMTSISAVDCARVLLQHWVSRFGVPSSVVSDQGRQFTSGVWSELASLLGMAHSKTTAYHPVSYTHLTLPTIILV